MNRHSRLATLFAVAVLSGCGGSSEDHPVVSNRPFGDVALAGITSTTNFSFDLGTVFNGKYYLTDRNNKAVDVITIAGLQASQITGSGANAFAGCNPNPNCNGANNGLSGPDGIEAITGTPFLYVGDVNSVKVLDTTTNTVVKTIVTGSGGFRADEGCFDPDDHLFMIAVPDADIPYAAIINTDTQTLVSKIIWVDVDSTTPAGGNEQCRYDPGQKAFIVNNDGTIANPRGEMEVIPVASVKGIPAGGSANVFSLAGVKRFSLGNCDPTGLALGPGTDAGVTCRQGNKGEQLTFLIMNRTNGQILTTLPAGGGDQTWYDPRTNRYFVAASRWHASGVNDLGGGCSATNLCTPKLFVIDAGTKTLLFAVSTGNNAHSVAVDPVSGLIFVPYSAATTPAGCADCAANGFINGGVSVFSLG